VLRFLRIFLILFTALNLQAQEIVQATNGTRTVSVEFPQIAIKAEQVAVVINLQDQTSIDVANYYMGQRSIPSQNLITLNFDHTQDQISWSSFLSLKSEIEAATPPGTQAYVLTFSRPWLVNGVGAERFSITTAISFCKSDETCAHSVGNLGSRFFSNPYLGGATPYETDGIRPTMMLAGTSYNEVKKIIDRGVSADSTFPLGNNWIVKSTDALRTGLIADNHENYVQYWNRLDGIQSATQDNGVDYLENKNSLLFYFIGLQWVDKIWTNTFAPGSIGYHATSYGGQLFGTQQMSALRWFEGGVTGSYGTVEEPGATQTRFPYPYALSMKYFGGATLIQSLLYSVHDPVLGILLGEPLARPFGPSRVTLSSDNSLSIDTTLLGPNSRYTLEGSNSSDGPFSTVQTGIRLSEGSPIPPSGHNAHGNKYGGRRARPLQLKTITVNNANYSFYRLIENSDTTPPILTIASPANNSVVSGVVNINANSADNEDTPHVYAFARFLGQEIEIDVDYEPPYTFQFDTTTFYNTNITFKLISVDSFSNETEQSITVNSSNPEPTVEILVPSSGNVLNGSIFSRIDVDHVKPISKVTLRAIKNLCSTNCNFTLGELTAPPWELTFNTSSIPNGSYKLQASAEDNIGNTGVDEFNVTFNNTAPTATPYPPTNTPTITPTNTAVPTNTIAPTNTPVPTETPTNTMAPTNTLEPTRTPTPTTTSEPTEYSDPQYFDFSLRSKVINCSRSKVFFDTTYERFLVQRIQIKYGNNIIKTLRKMPQSTGIKIKRKNELIKNRKKTKIKIGVIVTTHNGLTLTRFITINFRKCSNNR